MKIFNNDAYISAATAKNYATEMVRTHPKHMLPPDSPYFGTPNKALALEQKIGAEHVTGAGTFERAMLQALDKVSDAQLYASELHEEAIINPDSVDVQDIMMAQNQARLSLSMTQSILNRLVSGWRDLINTR